ncbi:unnamed protein product [Ambrosiozyma monospora]|uniref:Unnamed protein product n=1 Tax=Ambrosiozyma monospora TaxID=43982 RepID=A0ACB5TBT8_AMBMO|nr:unnamed protein product [Ambrosiozyma monospora]
MKETERKPTAKEKEAKQKEKKARQEAKKAGLFDEDSDDFNFEPLREGDDKDKIKKTDDAEDKDGKKEKEKKKKKKKPEMKQLFEIMPNVQMGSAEEALKYFFDQTHKPFIDLAEITERGAQTATQFDSKAPVVDSPKQDNPEKKQDSDAPIIDVTDASPTVDLQLDTETASDELAIDTLSDELVADTVDADIFDDDGMSDSQDELLLSPSSDETPKAS